MLDDLQVEEVMQENNRTGTPVMQVIANSGYADIPIQLDLIAQHLGTEVVQISPADIDPEAVKAIPADTARLYQCVPVAIYGNTVQVAFQDPLNPEAVDQTAFVSGKDVMPVVADPAQITEALNKLYPEENALASGMADILKELGEDRLAETAEAGTELQDVTQLADATPVVKFVNLVLYQAVQDRASDIHFEPFEDEFKIRYRVDGALYEMAPPPKHLALPVTSRLKVMANLNISERRLPQDGRISLNLGGKQIDFRISTLPTQFGESVVLRVLDRSALSLDLENLGLPQHVYDYMMQAIEQPNGIVVVTGPTGSGKTTTLYSCLRKINTIDSKLLTAEDPVEFDIEGIMQVAINESVGMTFMKALRSFLRQDQASTLRVPSSRKVRIPISRARARSTVAGTFS